MAVTDPVAAALGASQRLSDWIQALHPAKLEASGGQRIAAICFSIALDHREAILLLLQHSARSAAFALLRSVYEAWVRGCWAQTCATTIEIERIEAGGFLPKLETMVRRLDEQPETMGAFSRVKRSGWEPMSDYAHGEQRQISRWVDATGIGAAHPDDEVAELLRALDVYAILCMAGLLALANLSTEPCLARMKALFPDRPSV
ncbi:hypothetical protein J2W27_000036 [Variovorax boronicumulans]|uniref:DUF6988 family protein n=1 Tax=Variovorax boronicumulans TaxID=436515 RepID=UPI00277F6834|nr:hypothetical protein [Variovorax boronicumulans]MDP9907943.1 hypothetical protein [Variovorax boronicumulans]